METNAELKNLRKGLTVDGFEQERQVEKHNPYCGCGICAYCNGQEDVFGNPSSAVRFSDNGLRNYIAFQIQEGYYEQDRFKWEYLLEILNGTATYPRKRN